jgi:hypothetical protein
VTVNPISPYQHTLLRVFANGGAHYHMTTREAQRYKQTQLRSMLIREWIAYRPGRGFHLTREGRDAWAAYELGVSIERKNQSLPLTSYFDISQCSAKELQLFLVKPKHKEAAA